MKHEAWGAAALAVGVSLTAPQVAQLAEFQNQLAETAVPRGLIARSDRDRLWERHILDALRAAPEVAPRGRVLDLGSGAGIPGIPLAVALQNRVTLAEVRRGRVAFLESVVDRLGLTNVEIAPGRAETLDARFDVCTARAFAPAEGTWSVAQPLLRSGGILVYWAGSSFDPSDLASLGVSWRLSEHPDLADAGPLVIMSQL